MKENIDESKENKFILAVCERDGKDLNHIK